MDDSLNVSAVSICTKLDITSEVLNRFGLLRLIEEEEQKIYKINRCNFLRICVVCPYFRPAFEFVPPHKKNSIKSISNKREKKRMN